MSNSGSDTAMQQASLLILAVSGSAFAADCFNNLVRTTKQPTGSQIRDALTKNAQLDSICEGNWRVGDEEMLENAFNHGRKCPTFLPSFSTQMIFWRP
jgi:hypothetical protein